MPRGEANGQTYIASAVALFLDPGKLDATTIDRATQGWAYLCLIAHSRRRQTDGYLKTAEAERVIAINVSDAATPELTPSRRLADLRAIGLLKSTRWGYRIPDYADWQQTKSEVIAQSERQSAKGKASARKRTAGQPPVEPPANQRPNREEKSRYIHNVDVGEGRSIARDRAERDGVDDKNREEQEEQPLPAPLLRILPDEVNVNDLRPKQRQLLRNAWAENSEAVRHLMNAVAQADSPIGMLMTGCKRIVPSLDTPAGPSTEERAASYAERMAATGMETVDLYADLTDTWPDLTPEAKESIIRHATNPETEAE